MAEGFKEWVAGDVLAAADVNEYLMQQAVMRFDDATDRTADLTGVVAEGMVTYLKDDDQLYVYDGTNWRVASAVSTIVEKTSNYTLALSDIGRLIEVNSASNRTVEIPLDTTADFPVGARVDLLRTNTGEVEVVVESGVTLNSKDNQKKLSERWSAATVIKRAADTWVLVGDLRP